MFAKRLFILWIACLGIVSSSESQTPLGPGFTYQGHLLQNGVPVNGVVHLRVSLWDAPGAGQPPLGGNQLGVSQLITDVPVSDGVFTVVLNASEEFGANVFNGERRWLQIEVCADTGCASLSILSPRQPLTGTPYALDALSAPWDGLTGVPEGFADGIDNVSGSLWEENGEVLYTTGTVGIGSASPNHQLRIAGGPFWTSNGWLGALELDNAGAIAWRGNAGGRRFGIGQSTGGLYFFRTTSDPGAIDAAANYHLTIGDSGYVGVGSNATSPAYPLTINNGLGGYGWVHSNDTVEVGSYLTSSAGWLGTRSEHPLYFFTGDSGAQVILSTDGKMAIGTSTPYVASRFESYTNEDNGIAVRAESQDAQGVLGIARRDGASGVDGYNSPGGTGVSGQGLIGIAGVTHVQGGVAVDGFVGFGVAALAGRFNADVDVQGNVLKTGSVTRIDHPLDPENKYLAHSSMESSEMKNFYDGTVTTDPGGRAVVTLPDWFEALNKDVRYQLTVIGQFAQAIVEEKIKDSRFTIRTDKPNVEVSWQVTGIRNDAYAKAHPIEIEKEKSEEEKGKYLNPELFGQPKEKGIHYRPEMKVSAKTDQSVK